MGGAVAVGGNTGTGGTTGSSVDATAAIACEQGPVSGDRCTSLPAGKVCRRGDSCLGGCAPDCSCKDGFWSCENVCRDCMGSHPGPGAPSSKGPLVCSVFCDYPGPRLDASADAPDEIDVARGDGSIDADPCSGVNPSQVGCLTSKNQCVPSSCVCSGQGGWTCTSDCRSTTLPLCDGGVGADGPSDVAMPDAARDVASPEAAPSADYTCRDDSDCCIVVDTCMDVAYLYSKAPGATGSPSIPPSTGLCVPCIPPAIQVRCNLGQCVGEKISTGVDYESPMRKDHCGRVALPDAGSSVSGHPHAATSWGC
jgi:hypothetical protein